MKIISAIFCLCLLCSCTIIDKFSNQIIVNKFSLTEDELLLLVKVTKTEATDWYIPGDCPVETCIQLYYWYVYEAEVLEVLKGEYKSKQVRFANYQHNRYAVEVTNDWYVKLSKIQSPRRAEILNTQYHVTGHYSKASKN